MYYLEPKCLYRGEYKQIQLRVLSPSRLWECMNGVLRVWRSLSGSLCPTSPFIVQGEAQVYRV